MHKKQLLAVWALGMLLLSGCALIPDKPTKNDSGSMRVSGDVTVSTVDRKGF
jgi:hypothetical protein